MPDERIRLLLDMGASPQEAEKTIVALDKLQASAEKVKGSADKASGGVAGMGQSMLQTGRVVQDFAQGGLGGVLNNIEGLTMALGLGSGLAGALTIVGVVALVAGPKVKSFFQGLLEGSNAVPKATDNLKALDDALKDTTKELDALREKQSLTNAEFERFNTLAANQVQIEKDLAAEKSKRKDAEEVGKLKPFGVKEQEGERSDAMKTLFGDEGKRKQAIEAMVGQIEQEFKDSAKDKTPDRLRALSGEMGREGGLRAPDESHADWIRRGATNMLNRAIAGGGEQDIRNVAKRLPILNEPGAGIRRDIEESTLPENLRRQDADIEATEARGRGMIAAGKKRRAMEAARRRRADQLNQQGRENEDAAAGAIGGAEHAAFEGRRPGGFDLGAAARAQARGERPMRASAEAARRQRVQGAVRGAGGGGHFDLGAAHKMGGLDAYHQGQQAAAEIEHQTGAKVGPQQALAMVKQQQQALAKAQAEGLNAIMGAYEGNAQQIAQWKRLQQRIGGQLENSPMPSGMPR